MPARSQRIGLEASLALQGHEAAGGQVAAREFLRHHAHLQFADDDDAKQGFGQQQDEYKGCQHAQNAVEKRNSNR